ncbi:MAG: hypothetical protein ACTSO9_17295 [Candidatus Helarchaeota archaeon]
MLSRIRKIFSSNGISGEELSIQNCPIHGRTLFLAHEVNSRCALCDGYTAEELRKIIKRVRAREGF